MTTARHSSPVRRSTALRVAAAGIASALALVLGGTAASAHDTVLGTTPGDGETLTTAPTEVSIEVSAVPQEIGSRVVVLASDGSVLLDGQPTIDDRFATIELPEVPNDTYQVEWRLVSSDGHPIDGTFGFVVDDPAAASAAEPTADAATDPATEGTTTEAADPTTDATDAATADAASDEDSSGVSWLPVVITVVVVAGLVLLVLFRRRSALQDQS